MSDNYARFLRSLSDDDLSRLHDEVHRRRYHPSRKVKVTRLLSGLGVLVGGFCAAGTAMSALNRLSTIEMVMLFGGALLAFFSGKVFSKDNYDADLWQETLQEQLRRRSQK